MGKRKSSYAPLKPGLKGIKQNDGLLVTGDGTNVWPLSKAMASGAGNCFNAKVDEAEGLHGRFSA